MDPDAGRWVLKFLEQKKKTTPGLSDTLVKPIARAFYPSKPDYRPKNTALLRILEADLSTASIAEDMLPKPEVLEELCRLSGSPVSPALPASYCAAAVECPLKYLELEDFPSNNGHCLRAVDRIWRGQFCEMELFAIPGGSLLFSNELKRWSGDIEASLRDPQVRERLRNTNSRRDALQKLKILLDEAWKDLGPSSLELVASMPPATASTPHIQAECAC